MASVHAAHDGGRHHVWTGRVATHVYMCLRAGLGSGRTREGGAREGTREGTCLLSDAGEKRAGKEMLGKGQGKEHARLLTRLGMCAGEGR